MIEVLGTLDSGETTEKCVLVMDIPECCGKCPCFLEVSTDCCGVNGKEINSHEKPDWCPLRPVPKRAKHSEELGDDEYDCGYVMGFNDCLDEILGGESHD